ncbi:MAG: hypothetical protein H6741_19755 [Alphaproteobacteria bacterium]|nr:hypothetical protein [Alphaproteobacteria bacterium]MCB9794941.1 hypothetical protein [Alphaproteobacteria bacterium]
MSPALLARRRAALARLGRSVGLDQVERHRDGLRLRFIPHEGGGGRPASLRSHQLRLLRADGTPSSLRALDPEPDPELDFAWRVRLSASATEAMVLRLEGLSGLDPFFAEAPLPALDRGAPAAATAEAPRTPGPMPGLDYRARDTEGLRQALLDRLSHTLPSWTERNPLDLGMTLVDLLAHEGDRLSYLQDAVATEAHLVTARRRSSVRRHLRLLGQTLHEGNNARVWVQVQLEPGAALTLPAGTPLLPRIEGLPGALPPGDTRLIEPMAEGEVVFETLEDASLDASLDALPLHGWGEAEHVLPAGATRATLLGRPPLRVGDALLIEVTEKPGPAFLLRLVEVRPDLDPLAEAFAELLPDPEALGPAGLPVTRVRWHPEDALPVPVRVSGVVGGRYEPTLALARGNLVLADEGRRATATLQAPAAPQPHQRLPLPTSTLLFAQPLPGATSASRATHQDPRAALPLVTLSGPEGAWTPRLDLLGCSATDRSFVVEVEADGASWVRFGDGASGRPPTPGARYTLSWREGQGGDVGAERLGHVVTEESAVRGVRNPLPAAGRSGPEPAEQARRLGPARARRQDRCVTPEDFARAAEVHPEVQRAAACRRWSARGPSIEIAIDRVGGRALDSALRAELLAALEPRRVMGLELELLPAQEPAIELHVELEVEAAWLLGRVRRAATEALGPSGLLHPDRLSFGQVLYRSDLEQACVALDGVRDARVTRLRRWGQEDQDAALDAGALRFAPLELPRLVNDPARPHLGELRITVTEAGP